MTDVALINPPLMERAAAPISTPPLGLLYLASALNAAGHSVKVIDAQVLRLTPRQVADRVEHLGARIVGVTSMSPTAGAAYGLLKELRPRAECLVLGGPHVSALGPGVFGDCPVEVDMAFAGECERTLPEAVGHILSGGADSVPDLPGLLRPGGGASSDPPRVSELDGLGFPDRSATPASRYRHPLMPGGPVTSAITSRGCPYRCVFCDKHVCGRTWRPRSAENVLAELEHIALKTGISRIIIYDDLFTLDRKRVIEICRGIIGRGLEIRWKCEGRVNRVDAETLGWMRRAGCELIAYGVESAHPAGLEFLGKDITPEQAREAFRLTREAGIRSLGYFLLGVPGETIEDEIETARFAASVGADYAQFGTLSPFPGTPLYELAREKGWLHEAPARGPAELGGKRAVLLDGYWTLERLDEISRRAHRIFYFRPSYLARRLAGIESAGEIAEGARQGLGLLAWTLRRKAGSGEERAARTRGAQDNGAAEREVMSSDRKLRVCYFGTYSRGEEYARNNAIISGLEANGVEVVPCQVDVFPTHEEKMAAMDQSIPRQAWPFFKAYAKLVSQYLKVEDHDFVCVGYIGHIDMFPAWLLARLRKKPIVFDAFYSLYDTIVLDRGLYRDGSLRSRLLWLIDRWSGKLADLVLLDTREHVKYFCEEFGLGRSKFHSIPLGTDEKNFFPRDWPDDDGVLDLISYSSYIPLHGLDTQIEAARLLRGREDIRFTFVGKGQLYPEIRKRAEDAGLDNATFIEWISHAELVEKIAAADACLGIFGTTEKASRVIPYKAYEALAMAKPLLTGDSPAAAELLVHRENALLSPMGDAEALAESILSLKDDPGLARKIAENGHAAFKQHCTSEAMAASILAVLAEKFPRVAGGLGFGDKDKQQAQGKD